MLSEKADFDSIFCGNDLIAIGAMKSLQKNNLRIPEDVGVMGYDDIYLSSLVEPSLTTVRQPNYTMGYMAMELLLKNIKSPNNLPCNNIETIILDTEIIVRNSTDKRINI